MTLNGVMTLILRYFTKFGSFWGRLLYSKWLKVHLYCVQQKCSPKNLVFSDVSFMAIFAEVTENEYIIDEYVRDTVRTE